MRTDLAYPRCGVILRSMTASPSVPRLKPRPRRRGAVVVWGGLLVLLLLLPTLVELAAEWPWFTALGYGRDPRLDEAFRHLERKRRTDGRWNLSSRNWYRPSEEPGQPSKMITFLALRALRRAGRL